MPTIDLAFDVVGESIPLDHGYALFSALCQVVPTLHGDKRIGVHPIRGRQTAPGVLNVGEQSRLRLRMPSEEVAMYLAVAGSRLELEGHRLRVGIPRVESLMPEANLGARLVIFRGLDEAEAFLGRVRHHLSALGINGEPVFVPSTRAGWAGQPMRRVIRIKEKRLIGYALRVAGLTAEESITLQEKGLGGRRRMGCGVFVPLRIQVR